MSSAATAGPPPHRRIPMNGAGPADGFLASNGVNTGTGDGLRGAGRVFPHINDLLAARPEIDPLASIRKLLAEGERCAKQAESHLDFRRPDIALQEYIKASIIAVEIIPRHKDYPELKSDRGDLHRLYAGLQKRINLQHDKFEEIKAIIKENNAQNGMKSASDGESSTRVASSQRGKISSRNGPIPAELQGANEQRVDSMGKSQDTDNRLSKSNFSNASSASTAGMMGSPRQKPPVQPKPGGLHGRSIKVTVSSEEDLVGRFARLRAAEPHSPVQDPRIRTRSIEIPDAANSFTKAGNTTLQSDLLHSSIKPRPDGPLGPRDMPKIPSGPPKPQKIPLDIEISTLPKLPDAIYSPAWNLDNPATIDMLRSTSRSTFNTTGKSPSVAPNNSLPRGSVDLDSRDEYFGPAVRPSEGRNSRKRGAPNLPESTTVTAEDLVEYIKRGSDKLKMLLVDIRTREEFDCGHIMAQSIICVEPLVLRSEISAEDLGHSLVLSPDAEQALFEARATFDLLVYYDQSSKSIEHASPSAYDGQASLADFAKAIYDYGYEKRLKRPPMLLVGGLDAWIDLMSPNALRTSQTSSSSARKKSEKGIRVSTRPLISRQNGQNYSSKRLKHESRPLSKEEESKWEETLKEEADSISPDGFSFIKTKEEFFRRYPEPSPIQESMVSPAPVINSITAKKPHKIFRPEFHPPQNDFPLVPQIPIRPPPAMPRQSYSGVSERSKYSNSAAASGASFDFKQDETISLAFVPARRTGLVNFGSTCYMNSIFQVLRGTPILSNFLLQWHKDTGGVPRKTGEISDPPQLLVKWMQATFMQLSTGRFEYFTPTNLRNYIYQIHSSTRNTNEKDDSFGGARQHDAEEFLGYLLELLEDELNRARNKPALLTLTADQEDIRRREPLIKSSPMEWARYIHTSNSIISQNFRGQSVINQTCLHCGYVQRSWDIWLTVQLEIWDKAQLNGKLAQPLESALEQRFINSQEVLDYRCDSCHHKGSRREEQISRCSEILIIMLRRHRYVNQKPSKCTTVVNFPLDGLNMDPYFISTEGLQSEKLDRGFQKPFLYDCYAVVQHTGARIESGHYWSHVRERDPTGQESWTMYNDKQVTPTKNIYKETQDGRSYILFYRRRRH